MISNEQLATLVIRRAIFHDVPNSPRASSEKKPTLSDVETPLNLPEKALLRRKLVDSIGSDKAHGIDFLTPDTTPSVVPDAVRKLTKHAAGTADLVETSRNLAVQLFGLQLGPISPGLLCVMDVAAGSKSGIVLMKLERQTAAQLKLGGTKGKQTFSMQVFDDLVLGEGTRLFKSALFLRTGKGPDDFTSTAYDDQSSITSSLKVAKFWMSFLGCKPTIDSRLNTESFFRTSMLFINQYVTDPVGKSDLYDALSTEFKSNEGLFIPQSFIDTNIAPEYQTPFREYLNENNVPLTAFQKDLHDINTMLRRQVYITEDGVVVSVPENQMERVEVNEDNIVVRGSVSRVGK